MKVNSLCTIGSIMIYYTGDIHGSTYELAYYCKRLQLTEDDIIIVLGDVGANYYGGKRDRTFKEGISQLQPTILCIHGNHEKRPTTIPSYLAKERNGGIVWYEEEFPMPEFKANFPSITGSELC